MGGNRAVRGVRDPRRFQQPGLPVPHSQGLRKPGSRFRRPDGAADPGAAGAGAASRFGSDSPRAGAESVHGHERDGGRRSLGRHHACGRDRPADHDSSERAERDAHHDVRRRWLPLDREAHRCRGLQLHRGPPDGCGTEPGGHRANQPRALPADLQHRADPAAHRSHPEGGQSFGRDRHVLERRPRRLDRKPLGPSAPHASRRSRAAHRHARSRHRVQVDVPSPRVWQLSLRSDGHRRSRHDGDLPGGLHAGQAEEHHRAVLHRVRREGTTSPRAGSRDR